MNIFKYYGIISKVVNGNAPTDEWGIFEHRRGKLATATCVADYGVFPIGGSIDGEDQMREHGNDANYVPSGTAVEIVQRRHAEVVTYGEFHSGEKIEVVAVNGYRGFYIASAFA